MKPVTYARTFLPIPFFRVSLSRFPGLACTCVRAQAPAMRYELQLTGGHPNSLGNTVAVVDDVLAHPERLEELYACYFADDPVVRLRTSNAMKRIAKAHHQLLLPFLERLLTEVSLIEQASAQWTLAELLLIYSDDLTVEQRRSATDILKANLLAYDDWLVIIYSATTLAAWARDNEALNDWLIPQLLTMENDPRKSVSRRATKLLATLTPDT
jgi:hypothetical protein